MPVVGVDPGQTWTAAVLRVGDTAVHGWTMGPIDARGELDRTAFNDEDDWVAFARYVAKLAEGLDALVDYAAERWGRVRVGVEVPRVPVGLLPGAPAKYHRIPLRDWVMPRQVAAAVLGRYPTAVPVYPGGHGRHPTAGYPAELRGTRPPSWGINEARRGERDHERAAYDVAGEAARMPL
ncbi:hypothetical protein [Actinokineospora globicatena]|uniref:hypothetical protein n=1 Tax=Actinokineospora globicatena TaxID=103729 RepID=UPI0020A61653|nr:hypothetical protein [Actinokineospora globicatena]MCP2303702.1 hypothetical protein [Actinokineospora globicatena]GLW79160.1 hypothetical protein Aglo01_36420 [Actinokineospora globicatena]GLW86430.1 hypothetical protein Aglo02_40690 [Actinokineospora globicatena]